jgi:hypothetical protein
MSSIVLAAGCARSTAWCSIPSQKRSSRRSRRRPLERCHGYWLRRRGLFLLLCSVDTAWTLSALKLVSPGLCTGMSKRARSCATRTDALAVGCASWSVLSGPFSAASRDVRLPPNATFVTARKCPFVWPTVRTRLWSMRTVIQGRESDEMRHYRQLGCRRGCS